MIMRYPSQNKRIADGFSGFFYHSIVLPKRSELVACSNPLTICLNALMISTL